MFEGDVELNLDDVRNSDGLSYLYHIRGSVMETKEFLYGTPDASGSGGHDYKDRYLQWPKDMERGN